LLCSRNRTAERGDSRQQQQQVPVGDHQVGDEEQDLGLHRQHLPHVLHEHLELRHQVDHQEEGGARTIEPTKAG
jgi:hypothetical protein